jgi:two-component system, OmpR family, sensor histidine kinase BaeS
MTGRGAPARLSGARGAAMLVALVLPLAGLLVAFLLTLTAAARHFDRAAAAQAQLAAVSRIEALAATGPADGTRADLAALIADYRASIARETALLSPSGPALRGQRAELADADRLARLAFIPGDRPALAALVSRIGARERAEVADVAAAMARLRGRTTILAGLLAIAALGAALSGACALVRSNRDLTRLVEARTADLRAVDQSRRLFFAKASHELRTPVTAMRGEAEVSLADPRAGPEELRESLRHVVAGAEFLGRRIDELLGLSKADDGRLTLESEPLDLGRLIAMTSEAAGGYARSAEVGIDLRLAAAPVRIVGDARWLGQALLAIIDNGVKFSPQGARLRLALDAQEDGRARIRIADSGPGVMTEALPRIFDAYYQAEAGRMRGGTGLGLALARWVVEQHGGTIAAANDPAGGCTIAITLPTDTATAMKMGARGPMEEAA